MMEISRFPIAYEVGLTHESVKLIQQYLDIHPHESIDGLINRAIANEVNLDELMNREIANEVKQDELCRPDWLEIVW